MSADERPALKLFSKPLPPGERGLLARALEKGEIAIDDVEAPGTLFWRFEMPEGIPVGYGGVEVHQKEALVRAVLTLPPARGRGVGAAILAALETEVFIAGCGRVWARPGSSAVFFASLGYAPADASDAPAAIRRALMPSSPNGGSAAALAKRLR